METGEPRLFGRAGRMRQVTRVLDRWPGDGYRYFRVCTADGDVCILRHDERQKRWLLHYLESRDAPDPASR